ncbi:MAG: hypothetical protein JKX94_08370 [Sneathiella sp.]|nr:hypothetical protein [Sneathiella sp.]
MRIHEPLQALASLPGIQASASRAERIQTDFRAENRIFIWHRPVLTFEKSYKTIQSLRRAGYLIVTEFDDHHSPWPKIAENKFLSFAGVHAVQTTTSKLAEMFREFNPEVAVFPNQLNSFPDRELMVPGEQVRIFFGALNRQEDWRPILAGVNKALRKTKTPYVFDVVFDKEFFDGLETENKIFTPQCSYAVYKSRLLKADISLMPLRATGFNEMKSDLKLVESAGHGAVPVASKVVYGEDLAFREFSMICDQPDDFGTALTMLIDNPERRMSMQQKGRDYVKKNRLLCHHLDDRYDWYKRLLKNHNKLDQALEARLAGIVREFQ